MGVNIQQGHTTSFFTVNNCYFARDWNPSPAEYNQKARWKSQHNDRRHQYPTCIPFLSIRATFPAHLIHLDLIILIIRRVKVVRMNKKINIVVPKHLENFWNNLSNY
jgi:hypothetical protein